MFLSILFCTFMASYVLGLLVHEGGHWVVGRLLGSAIMGVRVGTGPVWYRGRLGTTPIELCRYPNGGAVRYLPGRPRGKLVSIVSLLGGVAGNVALLGLFALVTSGPSTPTLDLVAPGFVWAQIALIGISLFPHRGSGYASDGYEIVNILFRKRRAEAEAFLAAARAYRLVGDPSPWPPPRRILRGCRRFDAGEDRAAAARDLLREIDSGKLRRDETLLVLDKLITRHLLHGDAGLAERLDEMSRRAFDLAPGIGTLRGSRGASRIELGRYAEAKALLLPLIDGAPSFDTIVSRLFLARAEHRLGNGAEARRHLEAARHMLSVHRFRDASLLLDRVAMEIATKGPYGAAGAPSP